MCNVFTLVSTDPKALNREIPLAQGSNLAMRVIRDKCKEAVAGWGALITQVKNWEDQVERIEHDLYPLSCLGMTKDGHPRHPLYLSYESKLLAYKRG